MAGKYKITVRVLMFSSLLSLTSCWGCLETDQYKELGLNGEYKIGYVKEPRKEITRQEFDDFVFRCTDCEILDMKKLNEMDRDIPEKQ